MDDGAPFCKFLVNGRLCLVNGVEEDMDGITLGIFGERTIRHIPGALPAPTFVHH
ncbi:MAG: hypothetical protein A4E42_00773 [Methanoregulaceae archaeon PtaU1.Bin222]|nr:MAG: hypothetical protein A4E42_00773 [Methanoregulaceae archaeon PtaU1.Bin222]